MVMRIELKCEIDAPIARVFTVFSDVPGAARNVSAIERVELLSQQSSGAGTRWRETRRMFGKTVTEEMEITRFELGHCFLIEASSHGTNYLTRYDFVPDGDVRTAVSMLFVARPISLRARLLSFIAVIYRRASREAFADDLYDLKAACERSSP